MYVLANKDYQWFANLSTLVKETSLSKSTLTTMLERLEKSGHIVRKTSETDKRVMIVFLTQKAAIYEMIIKKYHQMRQLSFIKDLPTMRLHVLNRH